MDVLAISFLALVWIGLMTVVVALCAAAGRADRLRKGERDVARTRRLQAARRGEAGA